jgi:hypothetical protein
VVLELLSKEAQSECGPGVFEGPAEEIQKEGKMRKIASYVMVVLCFFMFSRAEAAVFNVTNIAELQNALIIAKSNGQDDTINLAPGTYTLSSGLEYQPVESENFSLTIQGAGAWATILDGGGSSSKLRIEQGALRTERMPT